MGDIDAHAALLVESVNTGFANSLVNDVVLRLVGTGTTPNNPGVVTSVLSDAWDWFETEIEDKGADLVDTKDNQVLEDFCQTDAGEVLAGPLASSATEQATGKGSPDALCAWRLHMPSQSAEGSAWLCMAELWQSC